MDDQKLWNLLGRSPRPPAPPFFAAKVMRRIDGANARPSWFAPLLRWIAPSAVAALVIVAVLPRPADQPVAVSELTTLDLVEMLSPEDYALLTSAEVYEDDDLLTAEL